VGNRSSIDRLPPEIRTEVDLAIRQGSTIDEIVGLLLDRHEQGKLAEPVSRSAVGRYSKQYSEIAERQRDMSSVAKAFASDFGDVDDKQGRLLVQLTTSLISKVAMDAMNAPDSEDGPAFGFKEALQLAKAVKDATAASKIDVDREVKIREEAVKQARKQAAEAAASSAKSSGASEETIRKVRAAILGISA